MSRATYENQNQRWCLRFYVLDENGKRKVKKIREIDRLYPTFPTSKQKAKQKEMNARARALEIEGMGGEVSKPTPRKETAQEYFTALIISTEKALKTGGNIAGKLTASARRKGVLEAVGIAKTFAAWLDKHASTVDLNGITPAHVMDYAQALRADGLCRSTIRHHLSRLAWVFKGLMIKDKIKRNPFDRRKDILSQVARADEQYRRKLLTPAQFKFLISDLVHKRVIKDDKQAFQAFAMLYFGIVTGWRQGDIVSKKWRDIDQRKGTIYNMHRKTKGENACETTLPLTAIGWHILDILLDMIGDGDMTGRIFNFSHKEMIPPAEGETEKEREEREALNNTRNARAFQHISKLIFARFNQDAEKDIVKGGKNKMTRTSYHSMRKTVISYLFGEDISESIILKMVGHADNTVERRHYQEFGAEHYTEAVQLLESAFIIPALDEMDAITLEKSPYFKELMNGRGRKHAREANIKVLIVKHEKDLVGWLRQRGLKLDEVIEYYRRERRMKSRVQVNE